MYIIERKSRVMASQSSSSSSSSSRVKSLNLLYVLITLRGQQIILRDRTLSSSIALKAFRSLPTKRNILLSFDNTEIDNALNRRRVQTV